MQHNSRFKRNCQSYIIFGISIICLKWFSSCWSPIRLSLLLSISYRFKETNDEVKLTYWKGKSTYVDQKHLDCLLCWYIYWYSDEDIPPSVIDTPSSKGSLLHRRRLPRLPGGEGPHRGLSQVNTTATCQSHSSISSFHVDVHQFYTFFWFNFYYQKYFISHHDISHIFSHIFSA